MSFASLLDHRVSLVRQVSVLDTGEPTYDEYNQPITADATIANIPAAVQPKTAREVAAFSQAGVALADYTVFMGLLDVTTADAIVHDPDDCPKVNDLPSAWFQLVGIRNPTGRGHHLSLDAKLVGSPLAGAVGS